MKPITLIITTITPAIPPQIIIAIIIPITIVTLLLLITCWSFNFFVHYVCIRRTNDWLTNQNPSAFAAGQESAGNAWTLSGPPQQCWGQRIPEDDCWKTSVQGCMELVGWLHTAEKVEPQREVRHISAWRGERNWTWKNLKLAPSSAVDIDHIWKKTCAFI